MSPNCSSRPRTSSRVLAFDADGCIRPAHVHADVVADGGERVLQTVHAAHQVGPDAQQVSLDPRQISLDRPSSVLTLPDRS